MPQRKRKEVEVDDGSYAGAVLGAFDRMAGGEAPASEIPLTETQKKRLTEISAQFRRSMQRSADKYGNTCRIEFDGKTIAEFKPRGKGQQ
jgi:hypothetical protein